MEQLTRFAVWNITMINAIATAIVATNVYGVYNDSATPNLTGLSGGILSPDQASEHIAQFDKKPEYLRLVIPQLSEIMDAIERDDCASFSFTVSSTGNVRLFEAEPETLKQVDCFKIHRTETVEQAIKKAILKYSKLGNWIDVSFHRGTCYITVATSVTGLAGI
jgi:hypothetical protein